MTCAGIGSRRQTEVGKSLGPDCSGQGDGDRIMNEHWMGVCVEGEAKPGLSVTSFGLSLKKVSKAIVFCLISREKKKKNNRKCSANKNKRNCDTTKSLANCNLTEVSTLRRNERQ